MHRQRTHGAAGVILVGGQSSRMGQPKADMLWHGTTLLTRMVGLLRRSVVGPIILVAAPDQLLPEFDENVIVVRDEVEGAGVLSAITTGLAAAAEHTPYAFVCSVDMPFLHPAFVQHVLASMDEAEIGLPVLDDHRQTLAAGYRTELHTIARELLDDGATKPGQLFEKSIVRELSRDDLLADEHLAEVDPELASVRNLNTPEEYEAALAEEPAAISIQVWGSGLNQGQYRSGNVPVSTLSQAALAMGFELTRYVMATLNTERVTNPDLPLVRGDQLAILGG